MPHSRSQARGHPEETDRQGFETAADADPEKTSLAVLVAEAARLQALINIDTETGRPSV